MSFTNCPNPTFLHANQIDALYTVYSSTQIKVFFDSQVTDIIEWLNDTHIPEVNTRSYTKDESNDRYYTKTQLSLTTDSNSGADKIGVTPISTLPGETAQTVFESIKARFDDIGATNTNVELSNSHYAADGRTYASIGARANTIDGEIVDINSELASNANLININTSNILSHSTQIAALSNPAPKAVSLIANMTDTTKNYVYTGTEGGYTAGNWYYYNGLAWVSGGVYMASAIGNGTITSEETNFTYRLNFFDKTQIVANKSLGSNVGVSSINTLLDAGSTFVSGQIFDVNSGDVLRVNLQYVWFGIYNASGVLTATFYSNSLFEYTIPASGKFVRFHAPTVDIDTLMITINRNLSSDYVDYNKLSIPSRENDILDSIVSEIESNTNRINIINPNKIKHGYYYGQTVGASTTTSFVSGSSFQCSEIYPVAEGDDCTVYGTGYFRILYYSSDNILRQVDTLTADKIVYIKVPVISGAPITQVGLFCNTTSNFMFAKGTYNSYYPYSYLSFNRAVDGGSAKKWDAIGDSWTEKNYTATKNYIDWISEELMLTCVNLAHGGQGFKNGATNYMQQALSINSDADVITMFGSGNDLGRGYTLGDVTDSTTATICGCMNIAINNVFTTLPTAKLGIITPAPWSGFPLTTPNNEMELYAGKLVAICKNRGIPCLDLYHTSGLRPWDSTQNSLWYENNATTNTHPNNAGHKFFYPIIREFIQSLI